MMMADLCKHLPIDTVVAPAVGAIALGHIVAKYLSYYTGKTINSVYFEKSEEFAHNGEEKFKITRGFEVLVTGKNIMVVEDISNSGGSAKRIMNCVSEADGIPIGTVVVCNRGNVKPEDIKEGTELVNLSKVTMEKFPEENCPLCLSNVQINTTFGHGKKFLSTRN